MQYHPITSEIVSFIKTEFGSEPEFLWKKTPNNAVFRHNTSKKWFAALLLNLSKKTLGLSEEGQVDVLNLKCDPLMTGSLIDEKSIFPGYHMNKEHWISVLLDEHVSMQEVSSLLDISYRLTEKRKTKTIKKGGASMTPKELVLNAIKFKPVPRTPVAVLDGYNWMMQRTGMTHQQLFSMDAEKSADFIIEQYEIMGSDMVYANAYANGALREVMGNGDAVKPALNEPSDIHKFNVNEVFEKTEQHPLLISFGKQLEALNRKIGDEKLILAFGTGPLTNAAGLLGMEPLMMALHEEPEEMMAVIDFAVEMTIKMLEYQVQHGATAISIADPVSSINLISEEFFEKYSLPGLKRINAAVKHLGLPIMLHICGDTTSRLEPLIGSGIDIFSLDSVDLKTALEKSRGDYAIFGNLNTVEVMLTAEADKVYELSKARCREAKTGFILAPGCDLPPATPYENIQAMVRAAKE